MANTVTLISYANTFGEWVIITNLLAKEINDLAANNYVKGSGTLVLAGSGTSLQVSNTALFSGSLTVSGTGSSATIQNNLTVGGQATFSNTLLSIVASGNSTFSNISVQGPGAALNVANSIFVGGNLVMVGRANIQAITANSHVNTAIVYATNVIANGTSTFGTISANVSNSNVATILFGNVFSLNSNAAVMTYGQVKQNFTSNIIYSNTGVYSVNVQATNTVRANTLIANNGVSTTTIDAVNGVFSGNVTVSGDFSIVGQTLNDSAAYYLLGNTGMVDGVGTGTFGVRRGASKANAELRYDNSTGLWYVRDTLGLYGANTSYYQIITTKQVGDTTNVGLVMLSNTLSSLAVNTALTSAGANQLYLYAQSAYNKANNGNTFANSIVVQPSSGISSLYLMRGTAKGVELGFNKTSANDTSISIFDGSSWNKIVTITETGNVTIGGFSTSTHDFEVRKTGNVNTQIYAQGKATLGIRSNSGVNMTVSADDTSNSFMLFDSINSQKAFEYLTGANSNWDFRTAGQKRLTITNDGSIELPSNTKVGFLSNSSYSTIAGVSTANNGITYGASYTSFGGPGLGISGYNGILFATAGSEKARFESGGALVLGATASSGIGAGNNKLAVNGSIGFVTSLDASPGTGNSMTIINRSLNGGIKVWSNTGAGTAKLYLSPAGNFIIGSETDSGYKLDIASGSVRIVHTAPVLQISSSTSTGAQINLHDTGSTADPGISSAGNSLQFNTNGLGQMFLTSAGFLGLGTSNPSTNVHLYTPTNKDEMFRVESTGNTEVSFYVAGGKYGNVFADKDNSSLTVSGYTSKKLILGTNNIDRVWIAADGKFGVGVEPTTYAFEMIGPEAAVYSNSSKTNYILLSAAAVSTISSSLNMDLTANNAASRIRLRNDGKILFNSTSSVSFYTLNHSGPDNYSLTVGDIADPTSNTGLYLRQSAGNTRISTFGANLEIYTTLANKVAYFDHNGLFVNDLISGGDITATGNFIGSGSGLTSIGSSATVGGNLIGYRNVPRTAISAANTTATTAIIGGIYAATGNVVVNNSTFAAGDAFSVYNNTSGTIYLHKGTITTQRLAGSSITGTLLLESRGIATYWFNSSSEVIVGGPGVSS